jgi:hypothetical protein
MAKKIEIIPHQVETVVVEQRVTDGFINATAMCAAHNKDLTQWFRTKETLEQFCALAESLEINFNPVDLQDLDIPRLSGSKYATLFPLLVISKRGSPNTGGGTWLHPDLAIQLAQRCSAVFAIQVSRWVREWMMTGQNPVRSQEDIDRLVYRITLKDESRTRAVGQVKAYLEKEDLYNDIDYRKKTYINFHDSINILITGEPAWKMKQRLGKILGRKVKENEFIRDYFPPMALQRYIAINEASAKLMLKGRHPIAAVEEAADLILPIGYVPTPIDFAEHIALVQKRVGDLPSATKLL